MKLETLWRRLSAYPGGAWLFTRVLCWKAPYFATIRPRFVDLRAGYCEIRMRKRRAVHNHIGTVHAIAMCNLAELAAGTLVEVSLPSDYRWIPKGMEVEYLQKANTDLRAVAQLPAGVIPQDGVEWPVTVWVTDIQGQQVFRACIRIWVTARKTA